MKKHKWLALLTLGGTWFLAASLFALEPEDGGKQKNPFALPEGVASRSKLAKKNEKEKLVLQAVTVTDGEKRIASISGENFMVGDEIYGKKLIFIGNDYVILERGPEKIRLSLERPPFSVRTSPERTK